MKILIVDSDQNIAELIKYELKSPDYQFTLASDGQRALNLVQKYSYDLMITDILLPFYSGLELINTINKSDRETRPKIIVLTKIHNVNTVSRAFQLGINDYITKPFDLDFLSLQVEKLSGK